MKVLFKYFVIVVILIGIYFSYMILSRLVFTGTFEKKYNRKDAIENYNKREKEITDLVNYFNSLVPDVKTNTGVTFGLGKNRNQFSIGIFLLDGSVLENNPNIGGSDIKINSHKADTLLKILKWGNEIVINLKEKLEKANCGNISSNGKDAYAIEFKYSGFGLHSYLIFKKPLSESLVTWYNSKGDTVIRKNVVVRFGSAL